MGNLPFPRRQEPGGKYTPSSATDDCPDQERLIVECAADTDASWAVAVSLVRRFHGEGFTRRRIRHRIQRYLIDQMRLSREDSANVVDEIIDEAARRLGLVIPRVKAGRPKTKKGKK